MRQQKSGLMGHKCVLKCLERKFEQFKGYFFVIMKGSLIKYCAKHELEIPQPT